MKYYLNIDENNYLLSIAKVGGGIEAEIDLESLDLSGNRIRAYKWENDTLIFDEVRYAEIVAETESVPDTEPKPTINDIVNTLLGVTDDE
jgi:hypothetical protein